MSTAKRLEELISEAYAAIGRATPIRADCGLLCGAACCRDDGGDGGDWRGYESDDSGNEGGGGDAYSNMAAGAGADDGAGDEVDGGGAGDWSGRAGGAGGWNGAVGSDGAGGGSDAYSNMAAGAGADDGAGDEVDGGGAGDWSGRAGGAGNEGGGSARSNMGAGADDGAGSGELGMLIYPGEARRLLSVPGFRLSRIKYMGKRVWFMACGGSCSRWARPLSCRVFPLAPHVGKNGSIAALPDPRARRMCPLADGTQLDGRFRAAVGKAFGALAREPKMLDFMRLISWELDDLRRLTT